MSPALTDGDLFDRRSTGRARFTRPTVSVEVVLEFSTAVKPVQAGAKTADTLAQDILDGLMQLLGFFGGQGV